MGKEAFDDYHRFLRDKESNSTRYLIFDRSPRPASSFSPLSATVAGDEEQGIPAAMLTRSIPSSQIRVGDLVCLEKDMRVPADMVLLRTGVSSASRIVGGGGGGLGDLLDGAVGEGAGAGGGAGAEGEGAGAGGDEGTCFVRTDQLDGETDWKLRVAVGGTQGMGDGELGGLRGELFGGWLFSPCGSGISLFPYLRNGEAKSKEIGKDADEELSLSRPSDQRHPHLHR